jgi:hypothetical protein
LDIVQKGVVDCFAGAEGGPECEHDGESAESQSTGECAQPRTQAGSEMNCGAAPAVEHYGKKPGGEHPQSGGHAEENQENCGQQGNSGSGQSLRPIESGGQWRGVGRIVLDCGFWGCCSGRKRFGSGDPNLGGTAAGAERRAVLDAGAAFITRMFH